MQTARTLDASCRGDAAARAPRVARDRCSSRRSRGLRDAGRPRRRRGARQAARAQVTKISSLSPKEIAGVLRLAIEMKARPRDYWDALKRKTLLMLFEKPSLRTRVSLEAGMTSLGGHGIAYMTGDSPIGEKETQPRPRGAFSPSRGPAELRPSRGPAETGRGGAAAATRIFREVAAPLWIFREVAAPPRTFRGGRVPAAAAARIFRGRRKGSARPRATPAVVRREDKKPTLQSGRRRRSELDQPSRRRRRRPTPRDVRYEDTGAVLSRMADAVTARVKSRDQIEGLAAWSTIPIINALDDLARAGRAERYARVRRPSRRPSRGRRPRADAIAAKTSRDAITGRRRHPMQMLADLQTIAEHKRGGDVDSLKGVSLAFSGDCQNNVTYRPSGVSWSWLCSILQEGVSSSPTPQTSMQDGRRLFDRRSSKDGRRLLRRQIIEDGSSSPSTFGTADHRRRSSSL